MPNDKEKKAKAAGNKVLTDDVKNLKSNVSDFATKQKDWKQSVNKGKPGYDASGKSNRSKYAEKLGTLKKGGSVKSKKK